MSVKSRLRTRVLLAAPAGVVFLTGLVVLIAACQWPLGTSEELRLTAMSTALFMIAFGLAMLAIVVNHLLMRRARRRG